MLTAFFLLTRIISNPLSNLFQKKLVSKKENPLFIIFTIFSFLFIASLPLIPKLYLSNLPPEYYFYMLACAVFAVSSNAFLVKALGYSDLSLLGPINSYKPIVGMFFGIILLHEIPSLIGFAGIVFILSGSYFIVDEKSNMNNSGRIKAFVSDKGIQFRFAALFLSGVEAVFLKKALEYTTPFIAMLTWCYSGFIVALIAVMFLWNGIPGEKFKGVWSEIRNYIYLFFTTAAMQFTTLLVFEQMQVSYALALFQISALISVFLGHKFFNEKNLRNRIIGSLLMIFGSVLIIIYGR